MSKQIKLPLLIPTCLFCGIESVSPKYLRGTASSHTRRHTRHNPGAPQRSRSAARPRLDSNLVHAAVTTVERRNGVERPRRSSKHSALRKSTWVQRSKPNSSRSSYQYLGTRTRGYWYGYKAVMQEPTMHKKWNMHSNALQALIELGCHVCHVVASTSLHHWTSLSSTATFPVPCSCTDALPLFPPSPLAWCWTIKQVLDFTWLVI